MRFSILAGLAIAALGIAGTAPASAVSCNCNNNHDCGGNICSLVGGSGCSVTPSKAGLCMGGGGGTVMLDLNYTSGQPNREASFQRFNSRIGRGRLRIRRR